MNHPFGDLISRHLSRRHGLSQSKLARCADLDNAVISKMCRGERLTGKQVRERVINIIRCLHQEKALDTRKEADKLLEAAGLARLQERHPDEAKLVDLLNKSETESVEASAPPPPALAPRPAIRSLDTKEAEKSVKTESSKKLLSGNFLGMLVAAFSLLGLGLFLNAGFFSSEQPDPTIVPTLPALPPASTPTLPSPAMPVNSIAVMGMVQGKVQVQRYEDQAPIIARPKLVLFPGDVLIALESSEAYVYCLQTGIFRLKPGRAVLLTCNAAPSEGLEAVVQFPPAISELLETTGDDPTDLTSLDNIRRARSYFLSDLGHIPVLLSPRRLISNANPVFRWTAVPEAEAYTLKVKRKTVLWEKRIEADSVKVSQTRPALVSGVTVVEFVYPDQSPALEAGATYLLTLQAHLPGVQAPLESDEKFYFEMINKAKATKLAAAEAQITGLKIPENEKKYLLTLLYQKYHLWTMAAYQLEILNQANPGNPPWLWSGEVYLQAGLPDLAALYYQHALSAARANEDLYTQAAALAGAGQSAYALADNRQATDYLKQSLSIYQTLGDEQGIKTTQTLLMEIK